MPITMPTISPIPSSFLSFAVAAVGKYEDDDAGGVDEVIVGLEGAAGFVEVGKGEDVCGFDLLGEVEVNALDLI